MKYFEVKPHSVLRDYIKCFWYLEKDYSSTSLLSEPILPDGCVDFVFQIEENKLHIQTADNFIRQPDSFVIGQQKKPITLTAKGKSITAGIRFLAYGAYPFLKTPISELRQPTIALNELLGRNIIELAEKIQRLPAKQMFREFENFLLLHLATFKADIEPVKMATDILFQQQGFTDIIKLAFEVNLSIRNLERKFDEMVGISPKLLARVIRFDQIKNKLVLNPETSLTRLSFHHGYFDQSHFIHDFKLFTGKTPSVFKAEVMKQPMYFYK